MNRKRAQSTLEYAVIIFVVVAGLLAMQTYIKKAAEGKLRESADEIGEQYAVGNTTYRRVTEQPAGFKTTETFGYIPNSTTEYGQGQSYYKVDTAVNVTTHIDGQGSSTEGSSISEKINQTYTNDKLFP